MATIGSCFRQGGFDLGFAALGSVKGDENGYQARSEENILVRWGGGLRKALEERFKNGGCRAWVIREDVELDDGEYEANVIGAFLEERHDML